MVVLIARLSKYDFWIPGGILTLEIKIQKKIFFIDVNFFGSKNIFGDFSIQKKSHRLKKFFSEFLFLESKFRQESKNHT